MAAIIYMQYLARRNLRKQRIFRDRTHPLEQFDDEKLYRKFRFTRYEILRLTDEVREAIQHPVLRKGSLTPVMQVLLALRFYSTGTFQNTIGDLFGVDQATVSRTVLRVTNALLTKVKSEIRMPTQQEADVYKVSFFHIQRFPGVFAAIDGTQVRIQAPSDNEHEYVNRKGYHSVNVQVVCNADLLFLNVVAKWPGSVHDAKILRLSPLFATFEGNIPPVKGLVLGDSGYMIRPWLMTPLRVAATRKEKNYNAAQSSTRNVVERSIGVAKQRWHCLRCGLRLRPEKACKVITVCFMLHNRARRLKLPPPPHDSSDEDSSSSSDEEEIVAEERNPPTAQTERARTSAGKAVRDRIINQCF